jgi:hypothetical protein
MILAVLSVYYRLLPFARSLLPFSNRFRSRKMDEDAITDNSPVWEVGIGRDV